MKNKLLKTLLTFLLCFTFALKVEAFSHSGNSACKDYKYNASTECTPVEEVSQYANVPKLYTVDCLGCSSWKTVYDGCSEVKEEHVKRGPSSTPPERWHEECKSTLVLYRTWKGDLTTIWPRCDKIKDTVDTKCDIVEGNACATCSTCCQWSQCPDEYGNMHDCEPCVKKNIKCTGVDANGGSKSTACVCSCSECYKLNHDRKKSLTQKIVDVMTSPENYNNYMSFDLSPGSENAQWAAERLSSAVNASCTTNYTTEWINEICTARSTKTAPSVCQPRYIIIPEKTRVSSSVSDNVGRYDAYCVNPALHTSSGITLDSLFDATTCATSRSTRNCGYANILIEGYLRYALGKYSESEYYQIISTALQLWGAHSGEAGYTGPGFSPESVLSKPDDGLFDDTFKLPKLFAHRCGGISKTRFSISIDTSYFSDYAHIYYNPATYLRFMYKGGTRENPIYRNIYTETVDNFEKYYLNKSIAANIYKVTSNVTGVEVTGSGNHKSITGDVTETGLKEARCSDISDDDNIGLCGTGSQNHYLKALYLYANTIQGNTEMQDHLKALIALKNPDVSVEELGKNNNPESITASINSETKHLSVTYIMPDKGKNMLCKNGATMGTVPVCCTSADSECDIIRCQPGDSSC